MRSLKNLIGNKDILREKLSQAVENPKKQLDFYDCLLKSYLYVITDGSSTIPTGDVKLKNDTKVSIVQINNADNELIFPIFSSTEQIAMATESKLKYIRLQAVEFFQMIKCKPCILNPGDSYSKEFTNDELVALLDGSLISNISSYTANAGENIMIGEPSERPIELISLLNEYFTKSSEVNEGYLAQIYQPGDNAGPHPLIAVKGTGNLDNIFSGAANLIKKHLEDNLIVDFVDLSSTRDFVEYFNNVEPFYKI